ncbi:ABC transporter ATP-binding protein [Rathayibacter sp. VKM Ac-2856]|uniref:ABC transporter ATP-binding protein n=1 Tax=unclassified Rathayibacter TaxID=2609250 RepID=UPI0015657C1A|nr:MULTISPECIES: ABC transporter ATP-binding protein [unclassified Rathayibacter]NQX05396.1 ABC transporter ATP-binding protein [Rathayibacter sp. VKM Ac-2858]NQX20729.1 ABC transporter ATP-binding protein [Rathayibacter sp. VKM Ac-2856]
MSARGTADGTAPLLDVEGVSRRFGAGAEAAWAVRDVSLRVEAGEVVALLGPNGAGKTTLARMIATLLTPTGGTIRVDGVDAVARPDEAKRRLALVLGGERGFFLRATALENLRYFASLADLPLGRRSARVLEVLAAVDLADRRHDRVEEFSRGMRQRLHLARGLLAEPPLLLLDEPTVGLDPEAAQALRALIGELRRSGRGIVLTTHYLHEAEELSDRSLVLLDGRLRAAGRPQDIAAAGGLGEVTTFAAPALSAELTTAVSAVDGVRSVRSDSIAGRHVVVVGWDSSRPDLRALAAAVSGVPTGAWTTRRATLEEGYLALVERCRKDGPSRGEGGE